MTSASISALCVLDACVKARALLKAESGFEKRPDLNATYGRIGIIEDLEGHVAYHGEISTDHCMTVSAEDFVLFGWHMRLRRDIDKDMEKYC